MLSGDALVIGDDHIARMEAAHAVALDAVANDDAEVGDEVRDATHVLREQSSVDVEQAAAVVADLVDHHVERRALQHVRHLIGNRRQDVANHLEGDDVQRFASRRCHLTRP